MAKQRVGLARRLRRLQTAERIKWNKYTWSGLIIVLVGLALIGFGLSLRTGAASGEGIAIGFGFLIILAGIIRVLIGVINPSSPDELIPYEEQEEREAERRAERVREDEIFDE